jgi:hypothetical protein
MGPPSYMYMRYVVDLNVVMRLIPVCINVTYGEDNDTINLMFGRYSGTVT